MASVPEALRRLAHPRSRRARLWACVYGGAVEDLSVEADGSGR